ncbi:MAG TPA: hypothetical protein VGC09_00435 [Rhodopila sp.]
MAPDGGVGPGRGEFYRVITEAVADIALHGYDAQWRIEMWIERIRSAAVACLTPFDVLDRELRASLGQVYARMVERGLLLTQHPGVSAYTLDRIKPKLRVELDRRIMASAGLIKLNRSASIERTIQRFSGWATSIPPGGSDVVEKVETKQTIRKALAQLPYEERRVAIDQGHKLAATLSSIVANENGALAGIWHSHFRQSGYKFRPDHKHRDGKVYAIRGNWAIDKGLMKKGPVGYLDEITQCGEEVFCRCWMTWVYGLRDLPADMLTGKGAAELERVRWAA